MNDGGKLAVFKPLKWTKKKTEVAILRAEGYTQRQVSEKTGVSLRTVERWCANAQFDAEVDRLTLMTGVANKAERLRICKRAIRQCVHDEGIKTRQDLLSWIKHAQGETDGIKLDLSSIFEDAVALAGGGSSRDSREDSEATSEGVAD